MTVEKILNDTFDTKFAIATLYLWLLFGYLSSMVSCDLQKWMQNNVLFRHFIGLVAFFFLFTVLDMNRVHISIVFMKTLVVYVMFLMMVKSKWYFSIPVILILIIDQAVKAHMEYLEQENQVDNIQQFNNIRKICTLFITLFIVIGFLFYAVRQYQEFGEDFSWYKLIFTSSCKVEKIQS